ncbi:MAG: bifunctional 3,4-dihydroxy-2-butanone-4-phosphate synthase/GTP cyclohydrolase II [Rhodothermales bacterium]|nr:bifunctional 3,4-dihydroxy-2-butanone-4-phosphate synthase/GTP cyclohydrolase II [Rhodothermales bacterium]
MDIEHAEPNGSNPAGFDSIEAAIQDIRDGRLVIVVDDEERENEGDFIGAAATITPELVNFMATQGRGLICVPLTRERTVELNLDMMVSSNTALHETSFTVSVDYRIGTSTGISAADRARTIAALADPTSRPDDFARPGHVFPLRALEGGVLRRTGHTEAAVDLARLAGFAPAGVLVEILNEDGSMARVPELRVIARQFDMRIVTIKDLIAYRLRHENLVRKLVSVHMPTRFGDFTLTAYEERLTGDVHLALHKGEWTEEDPVLVRVHSQCVTGDIFGSMRCDCGDQLAMALQQIELEGRGVLLYMKQEGRGIGLVNKLLAYKLQEEGMDTVEANEALGFDMDHRDYGTGCQILRDLGIRKMRLMTNNPTKRVGLAGYGLEIVERVSVEIAPNDVNEKYLRTKRDRMGHLILGELSPHDAQALKDVL